MILSVILILIVIIVIIVAILVLKNKLSRSPPISITGSTTRSQPANYALKLLLYATNVSNTQIIYGLFQKGNNFWLVAPQANPINVLDIYPHFKGTPIGLVVVDGSQDGTNSFIIFSSDGKVYNPLSLSHPWRRDFFNLPQDDPISIDGRSGNAGSGIFNNGNRDILFRFYYTGYYMEESGCYLASDPGTSDPNNPSLPNPNAKSCPFSQVAYLHPPFNVRSFYTDAGVLYSVSSDGNIYSLSSPSEWSISSVWTNRFGTPVFPDPIPLTPDDKSKLVLVGADYDHGVPIFIVNENKTLYLIDRSARKYDIRKMFKASGILLPGNIIDFTKAGSGEADFIIAVNDGNLYGPTLQSQKQPLSLFTSMISDFSPAYGGLVGFTSVNKWQPDPATNGGLFKFYLVFLFSSGRWFEIKYDIPTNTASLDNTQSDLTSGLWTSWSHIKSNYDPSNPFGYKISSFGWSLFNVSNRQVYSINNTPESWMEMLYCSVDTSGTDDVYKTYSCVGLGGAWKNFQYNSGATGDTNNKIYLGRDVYEDYGTDTVANPGIVIRKIPLDTCLGYPNNAIVYDENESDCHLYDSLQQVNSFKDPSKATFVVPSYDPTYQNRFCVKHQSGKYLYWDFTDSEHQHLGLNDTCIYNGLPNLANANTGDIQNLEKSMGAMWSIDGQCLENLNGVMGGSLQKNMTMATGCDGNFTFNNGQFGDGTNCLISDGASSFSFGACPSSPMWSIEDVPCPVFSSTGYIFDFCNKNN